MTEYNQSSVAVNLSGPSALRELAKAFGHIQDFRRFTEILESALGKAAFFETARIQLFANSPLANQFPEGHLVLPLAGQQQMHGMLTVSGGVAPREFGAEDIHLLSSLGAIIAAALDHALRHGEIQRNLDILTFILNLAPVGFVALDAERRVLFANDLARRWLDAEKNEDLAKRLTPEILGVEWWSQSRFHLRAEGRLVYGESCTFFDTNLAKNGANVIVLTDMTAEQIRLFDGLQRELYRCRWLETKLSFVLLESTQAGTGLLQRLPDLRAVLKPGEITGPYDAFRVGLVLPELDRAQVLARLRSWGEMVPSEGLRAAVVTTSDTTSAESVLSQALAAMKPVEDLLRRVLLLHDDYAAVNDMLEMVLGRDYDVVKSSNLDHSMDLLRSRPFDGLVTEVDLRSGESGVSLALLAKQLQPSIRPFFTTVAHAGKSLTNVPQLSDHVVIRKPFDVRQLEQTIRDALI
jgi:PAS domain-containing protein